MPLAARVTDPTTHGTPLGPGPGSANVLIGGLPAWRATTDQHTCPATSVSGADGAGSVLVGCPTVLINNTMACRQGDIVVEKPGLALSPTDPILMGCPTVLIGEAELSATLNVLLGQKFNTPEKAAIAAMQWANPGSVVVNREFGGWIVRNADGTYSVEPPVIGSPAGLDNIPPKSSTDVVWWHTHGAYDPKFDNENFSGNSGDKGYSKVNNAVGYVATPSGAMKKYDPTSDTEAVLSDTAPPNKPYESQHN